MGVYIKEDGELKPVTANTLIRGAIPIPPTGNIDITTTETVDVTAYATAKVVDSDLVSGNIKKDVNILGITGTYEGESIAEKSVRFFDYDGTLVASYDAEEFQELTALPANPVHQGLTAQGWNWSLADAKEFVLSRGGLDIGQNYVTSDGKTRIYVHLTEALKNGLKLSLAVSGTVSVDWGDNSSPSSLSGSSSFNPVSVTHNYLIAGDYTITITPSGAQSYFNFVAESNESALLNKWNSIWNMRRSYLASIIKIELGTNVGINASGLAYCINLTALNIPIGTSTGDYMVSNTSIPAIIIPTGNGIVHSIYTKVLSLPSTIVKTNSSVFEGRDAIYIPDGAYNISDLKSNAENVILPSALTTIPSYCFQSCRNLKNVDIPSNALEISESAFTGCSNLTSIDLKAVTTIRERAFNDCHSLTDITMDNVTSIGQYAFSNCWHLQDVVLPNITTIPDYLFSNCCSLNNVTIPASVTGLGQFIFSGCTVLSQLKFKGSTPPSALNANWYSYVPTSCKILVPAGSLSAYTSATNYPDPDTYTYEEYTEVE